MSLKVIAITGPKGSGKDTIGQIIKENYTDVETIAFADPIKKEIQHIFQLDLGSNEDYDRFKRSNLTAHSTFRDTDVPTTWKNISGRHVVREIGMLMRRYDEKQFAAYVKQKIQEQPNKIWVVTDLRFDNEYTMLKDIGAKFVKIKRPAYTYDGHITEREFNDSQVDRIIMNDNSLEYLRIRIEVVMKNIMKEWE
jgi:energy-coupling factor transporter ATP-binding protein EcfA2